ncbi:hypothetical protein D2E23_1096 [Bifidobacterium callimiconis]|uniref:4Fe-4S Wbl-type domain-containing protein n=1 Tax=Bifidobacterium callimiconis TaxID=2306973 RepID=A0A430FEQ5_9BIFI|nr:hypothetical protein D2E23_1096 [Bifidobacterium callimiconis]
MTGMEQASCVRVAARSQALADQMFAVPDSGRVDRRARRVARRLCDSCPVRDLCLSEALARRTRDNVLAGGLTYQERCVLSHEIAADLGVTLWGLASVSPSTVLAWLREHPRAVERARSCTRAYWRDRKRSSSAALAQGRLF